MRYYSKTKMTEVFEAGDDTITSDELPWWFEPLPEGFDVEYDGDGVPHKVPVKPLPPTDPLDVRRSELRREMNDLVGDLTAPEAMFLMLQYGMLKMNANGDPSDEPAPSVPLTPTGEDLEVWGDRIASSLEQKIIELRSL